MDPLNWDCGCTPTSCDTLVISHALFSSSPVELSASFFWITSDGEFVSEGPLLTTTNSAQVLVDGTLSVRSATFYTMDSVVVHGILTADTLLLYDGNLRNFGTVNVSMLCGITFWSDGLWNEGDFECGYFGSFTPAYTYNFGWLRSDTCTTTSLYNQGTMEVHGPMFVQSSLTNGIGASLFILDTLQIVQYMEDYGFIQCGLFVNGWSIGTAQSQIFSGGVVQCVSFLNQANGFMNGPGTICISGHSENHGAINAPITICDISLDVVAPPYLDVNTGGFLQPISYCTGDACESVGMEDLSSPATLPTAPNPATDHVVLDLRSVMAPIQVDLSDALGQRIHRVSGPFSERIIIGRESLAAGLYFVTVRDRAGSVIATSTVIFSDN